MHEEAPQGQGGSHEPLLVALSARAKLLTFSGALVGLFVAALDQTIVATAAPRLVADLNGFDRFAWVFTAYLLTATIGLPIAGKLSDLYGRKWVLMGGIIIFMAGSMLAGSAQTMNQLIVYRAIQGIGAAGIFGNVFTVLADLFWPAERGKWQGYLGTAFVVASVIGPLAGGTITDNWSWRWIFYINLPVGLLALSLIMFSMPAVRSLESRRAIDYLGAATLVSMAVPLLLALTWAGDEYSWGSAQIIGMLLVSAGFLLLFLRIERSAANPLIPLWLFSRPIFSVGVTVIFGTGAGMFTVIIFIPFFVQGVTGASATTSGLLMVPMHLTLSITSVLTGLLIGRTGKYKVYGLVGLVVMALGLFLLSQMDETTSKMAIARNMSVVGFGLGVTFPAYLIAVQNIFEQQVMGVVTATAEFFRTIGGTVGVAIMGTALAIGVRSTMQTALSGRLTETLPADVVGELDNAQLTVREGARHAIESRLADQPTALEAFHEALALLRTTMVDEFHGVFLIGLGFVAAAFVVSLFLKEVPLRGRATVRSSPKPQDVHPVPSKEGDS